MNTNFNTKIMNQLNDRDILQNKFDISFANSDFEALRNHYRNLRNIELNSPLNFPCETIPISSLAESITLACDVICAECGTSFIYCGNEVSPIWANSKFITKAILNLLSNAFLYGKGELITIKTIEKSEFVSIEIQSAGALPEFFRFGKGLSFVKSVCENFNGHFFIETTIVSTKTVMLIPKSCDFKDVVTLPDFCELLSDRLSPVYIEIFGAKYHNI